MSLDRDMNKMIESNKQTMAEVVGEVCTLANQLGHEYVAVDHAAYVILKNMGFSTWLKEKGVDVSSVTASILGLLKGEDSYGEKTETITPFNFESHMTRSFRNFLTKIQGSVNTQPINSAYMMTLIVSMPHCSSAVAIIRAGITPDLLKNYTESEAAKATISGALAEYCVNINEKVKEDTSGDPLVGRSTEIFNIAHTMSRKSKTSVCLVGEPGVGKTAIVEGLAKLINSGEVHKNLQGKVIFALNVSEILAGSRLRGDFEEKIKLVIAALVENQNAILFIDEAHQMDAGAGSSGSMGMSFSTMFKPELSRGRVKVIAATTWEGFRTSFEKDSALMRRFRVVKVGEPSEAETIQIMLGLRKGLEDFHKTSITDKAIEAAVQLTGKYQHDRFQPDKTIDLIDSTCARNKLMEHAPSITREMIVAELSEITGIPITHENVDVTNSAAILDLADKVKNVVLNQNKAVEDVCEGIVINSAGLNDGKPNSYILAGPSGVGKTFLAKTIASNMGMSFLRYDMSEYSEKHTVSKLIGCPPGYVGYDSEAGEGLLVHDLLKNPNSVILFDEIEKADPSVSTIFLQLLDEGRITGSTGKTASAKNCIIMFTSNLGSRNVSKSSLGYTNSGPVKTATDKAIEEFFLPELRGRVTKMITFDKLDSSAYREIANRRISELSKMLAKKNITVKATPSLLDHIVSLNDTNVYGARRINNLVDSTVKLPLSMALLKGEVKDGETVLLDWNSGVLNISAKTPAFAMTE